MKYLLSTRVVIPLCLLLLAATTLSLDYATSRRLDNQHILDSSTITLRNTLNYLQSSSELFLSLGANRELQNSITSFILAEDLIALFVADPAGIVVAATNAEQLGKHWNPINHAPLSAMINAVSGGQLQVTVLDDGQVLAGMTRICNFSDAGIPSPQSCGVLYIEIDLAYHLGQIELARSNRLSISGAGTVLAAGIILLILTLTVSNRARDIIKNISRFKQGDRKTRIIMHGNNELVSIGNSINELFDKIDTDDGITNEKRIRYESLIDTMPDGLITVRMDGTVESMNLVAEELLGYSHHELIDSHITLFITDSDAKDAAKYLNGFIDHQREQDSAPESEVQVRRKDGSVLPVRLSLSKMEIEDDTVFIGVLNDISHLKSMEEQLMALNVQLSQTNARLAKTVITDSLTDLYNRRHFDSTLLKELKRSTRQLSPLSLIVIDIDFFKQYNDHYGHAAGDECLIQVSKCMKKVFKRSGDMPSRYGGEEFAIILAGCDGLELQERAETMRSAIYALQIPHESSRTAEVLTVSIGAVSYKPVSNNEVAPKPRKLFTEADKALYRAKASGRNQVVYAGEYQPISSLAAAGHYYGHLVSR
ncbi:MAG: diguanylate cyclase [Proteobacteria bacterium]|nr:diguanylate cyclase [Pseudomonadota bacterium]